ncbi:MAG: RNA 2',3'-cyclic phosphodiesterase [Pseudomonadota bacterium]
MRTFIALSLPAETRNALGDVTAQMAYQDKSHAVRWVDQENFHITLAFLGELSTQDVDVLADELDQTLSTFGAESTLMGLSPFPESRPKLIAAMLSLTDSLADIYKQTQTAIANAHLVCDKRKFIPHITLGRFRHSKNLFCGAIPLVMTLPIEFEDLVVYESHLRPNGAEYEPIYRYSLNHQPFLDDILEYQGSSD